jgi:hypothetical protein
MRDENDIQIPEFKNIPRTRARAPTPPPKNGQLYSTAATPLSYSDKSVMKTSRNNPLTRVKPLRPNILDQLAVDNVNWMAAQKRAAGSKWVPVRNF